MKFNIVDTESAYRRLLAAPDAAAREAIVRDELAAPFAGLVKFFGGSDGLQTFAQWGLSPEQFSEDNRDRMRSMIDTLAAHRAWDQTAEALNDGWAAFDRYAERLPLQDITFGLYVMAMRNDPHGYTGFGGIPGWIMTVYAMPTEYNLKRIKGVTVHELHHNLLGSISTKNFMTETTVGDYMVMEGLAESFATELYGEEVVGYFVSEFDEAQLEATRNTLRAGLRATGFNQIRAYIFGGDNARQLGFEHLNLPPFSGYALGYHTVQAYLKRTGKSVVEATFVPAEEIIAESGYFD